MAPANGFAGVGPGSHNGGAQAAQPRIRLCLLKSPFLLPPLKLQRIVDTLLDDDSVLLSLLQSLHWTVRSRAALQLEVLALRHQLQVLQRTRRSTAISKKAASAKMAMLVLTSRARLRRTRECLEGR